MQAFLTIVSTVAGCVGLALALFDTVGFAIDCRDNELGTKLMKTTAVLWIIAIIAFALKCFLK